MNVHKIKALATELQTICELKQAYIDKPLIWDTLINDEEVHLVKLPYTTPEEQEIVNDALERLSELYNGQINRIAAELKNVS